MPNAQSFANDLLHYAVGKNSSLGTGLTRYIRLWTLMPGLDGSGGTEVSGGGYGAYLILSPGSIWFNDASGGSLTNTGQISWGAATSDWGTVVGLTFESASSGGTFYMRVIFSTAVNIVTGETLRIPAGNLTLTQV